MAAKMLAAALGIATLAAPAPAVPGDLPGLRSYSIGGGNATLASGPTAPDGSGSAGAGGPGFGGGAGFGGAGGSVPPAAAAAPVTAFAPGGLPGIGLGPSAPDRRAELPLGPGAAPLDIGGPATAAVPAPEPPALAALAGGALLLALRRRPAAA